MSVSSIRLSPGSIGQRFCAIEVHLDLCRLLLAYADKRSIRTGGRKFEYDPLQVTICRREGTRIRLMITDAISCGAGYISSTKNAPTPLGFRGKLSGLLIEATPFIKNAYLYHPCCSS